MTTQKLQPEKTGVERMNEERTAIPAVDIYEGADETWVVADLPGVKSGDVHIELEKNELRLRAKARAFADGDDFAYARSFRLPPGIDSDKVNADFKNGVLTLKLPKPAELKPRKIDVKNVA